MLDAHQLLWTQIAAGVCTLNFGGWDRVEGVITASEVEQPASHVSDDLDDGQDFDGDQVQVGGPPLTTRVLARRLIARYPVGAHVDVYVDPKDPKSAARTGRCRQHRRAACFHRYLWLCRGDYVGTSANPGWTPIYGLREQAEAAADQYKTGAPVAVYYDPDRPVNAVLEPDNRRGSAAPLVFGAISAVGGGAMLALFVLVGFGQ